MLPASLEVDPASLPGEGSVVEPASVSPTAGSAAQPASTRKATVVACADRFTRRSRGHGQRMNNPFYREEHEAFRQVLRRFVETTIAPHIDAWDEAGEFPRSLYRGAAEIGLLGVGFPE